MIIFAPYRGMEQLVARRAHNPKVTGSSPVPATINFYNRLIFNTIKFEAVYFDNT